MRNRDLIAFLKPIPNQFSAVDSVEFIDVTGQVTDIQATRSRLALRLQLPAGLYRGRFETITNAFDMSTAMIEMVQVPDGRRVPVGPWDLDHIHNVMAMPMACAFVNGKLKGGLWFAMPGPEQIAEGRLAADFGFEAEAGENELVLEIIERDRQRIHWGSLDHFEIRSDDRRTVPLEPAVSGHPRIFLTSKDVPRIRERWQGSAEFRALEERLRTEELVFLTDNSQGTLEVALLLFALTGDPAIGARAKARIMELAHAPAWCGRPDPLLMGGENDRFIGHRLYHIALAWDYLQPLLNDDDRRALLSKAGEYLQKVYDFTLLQRAYMGCPSIDPHSLGAWNGAAIACMAFYDDLPIARHALPFFHGLFCDSLSLFPASGKAAWATYFPFHLILYLAAAHVFGGKNSDLSASAFLDHLGPALLAAFDVPNSQELQRGLRTREHRFLTAFLCRFHPTPGIESIYRAFAEKERQAAGDVMLGIFDLLYAPDLAGETAAFPHRPLFARDVGDLIAIASGQPRVAVSLSGGPKAGRQAIFTLMPHNREFAPSLGAIDITIDGTPVLCNINMGLYGLNSALTNTMCFEEGGAMTNGQYLNGDVPPEACGVLRRCFIDERYVYAHVVITHALDPKLEVRRADRIFVFDRKSGTVLLSDAFQGTRALRFATHLHCSGSVKDLGNRQYRLTGGQANRIAGIKGGSKGLNDDEKGELFVQVLRSEPSFRVLVEEPTWVPGYIYGLNNTGKEEIGDGRFPRYNRWRLEVPDPVAEGSFLFAVSPQPGRVQFADGTVLLPDGGGARFGRGTLTALGVDCECEWLLWDEAEQRIAAMGLRSLRHGDRDFRFAAPVDIEYCLSTGAGTLYAQGSLRPDTSLGFAIGPWTPVGDDAWKTHNRYRATFAVIPDETEKAEGNA
ncbi:MAG: hypothetical protein ACLGXA_17800 [Acidobacteriota bacterium]